MGLAMADLRQQVLRTSAHEVPCICVTGSLRDELECNYVECSLYSRAWFGLDTRRVCLPAPLPPEKPQVSRNQGLFWEDSSLNWAASRWPGQCLAAHSSNSHRLSFLGFPNGHQRRHDPLILSLLFPRVKFDVDSKWKGRYPTQTPGFSPISTRMQMLFG